jgi:hypothetical protein
MEPPPAWARHMWLKDGSSIVNGISISFANDGRVTYINAGHTTMGVYLQGYVKIGGGPSLKLVKFGSKLRLLNENNGVSTDFKIYPNLIHFP